MVWRVSIRAMLFVALLLPAAHGRDGNARWWQLESRPRRFQAYSVTYRICLLTCDDALKANSLAKRLQAIPDDRKGGNVSLPEGFRKVDTLVLRYHSNSRNIGYRIDPEPVGARPFPDVNEVHSTFDKWHMCGAIPYVTVHAEIQAAGSINPYEPLHPREKYLEATPAWPVGSERIQKVLSGIPIKHANQLTELESLMRWLRFDSGIRQGVERAGERATRYGVAHTLETKQGNCWDFSDLFVTLCRSVGLPCRQVAGWQLTGGGHLWAEVYLDNIGWIQVNPTTGKTITGNYLPLFTTSDGDLSYVFRSFPVVRTNGGEEDGRGAGAGTKTEGSK